MGQANNDNDECICLLIIYSKFLRRSCCQRLTSGFRPLPKHLSRLVTPNTSTPHTTVLFVLLRAKQPQVSKARYSIVVGAHKLALAAEMRVASSRSSSLRTS